MSKIRILHAPENAAFAGKIAGALNEHNFTPVLDSGHGGPDPRDDAAVIVVWSPKSVVARKIIDEARRALARRMLVPVAIGRISPPSSFEHVWPMDLAGWTGKADDPRWNFVLEEIDLAARRARAATIDEPFGTDGGIDHDDDDDPGAFSPDAGYKPDDGHDAEQEEFNGGTDRVGLDNRDGEFSAPLSHRYQDAQKNEPRASKDANRIAAPRRRTQDQKPGGPQSGGQKFGGLTTRARAAVTPLAFVIGGLFGALMLGGAYLMGVFNAASPVATSAPPQNLAGAEGQPPTVAYLDREPAVRINEPTGGADGLDTNFPDQPTDDGAGTEIASAETNSAETNGDASAATTFTAEGLTEPGPLAAGDGAPISDAARSGAPAAVSPEPESSNNEETSSLAEGDGSPALDAPLDPPVDRLVENEVTEPPNEIGLGETGASDAGENETAIRAQPAYSDQSFPATGGANGEDLIARLAMAATRENVAASANLGGYFRECVACPDMATLQAGSFMIGAPAGEIAAISAEGPQTPVSIPKSFAIAAREVTFEEWDECVRGGGCQAYRPSAPWGRGRQPVVNVGFADALAYADWLSQKTGSKYRLPTEAEWEYAARAGAGTAFSFGNAVSPQIANYHGGFPYQGPRGIFRAQTTQAGTFAPNAFGLYDMHGNVWEWTSDCWRPNHASGEAMCYARVVKGGAWNTGGWRLRSAHRNRVSVDSRGQDTGFRVVRDFP